MRVPIAVDAYPVQVSMICYRLLGGGTTNPTLQPYIHPSRFQPGGKANMFSYKGPRHVKVLAGPSLRVSTHRRPRAKDTFRQRLLELMDGRPVL